MNSIDLSRRISAELSDEIHVKPVADLEMKTDVADATRKYLVYGLNGIKGFLLVSGSGNTGLVERAVNNIHRVSRLVSPDVSRHVLKPIVSGDLEGTSFAVWPKKEEFLVGGRIGKFVRTRRYIWPVLEWNIALARETLRPTVSSVFQNNLDSIHNEVRFPQDMRNDALQAKERIICGSWNPVHCVHHGDFWSGNVLLPNTQDEASFYIIDWAGMQEGGYPFFDLARMLMSLGVGHMTRAGFVAAMSQAIGGEDRDAVPYILAALGHLGANLEFFPEDRYRAMAIRLYRFMK